MRLRTALLASAVALSVAGPGHAAVLFTANITTTQETTPVLLTTTTGAPRPTSFGTATLTLNDAQTALTFTAQISNIDPNGSQTADPNDNLSLAHIHNAPPGVAGPVVWGFFGTPFNDTNPTDTVITPFASGVGFTVSSKWDAPEGNGTTLTAQLSNLLNGLTYLNFHTVQNPAGEIRGQILPVPEPTTLALVGSGLAGLLGLGRLSRGARRRDGAAAG